MQWVCWFPLQGVVPVAGDMEMTVSYMASYSVASSVYSVDDASLDDHGVTKQDVVSFSISTEE